MTLARDQQLSAGAAAAGLDATLPSIAAPARGSDHADLCSLLAAAADPVRLRIFALLRQPLPVQEICARLGLAQPRASHHLAVLRACGLVAVRADGRRRIYAWAPRAMDGPVADMQALLGRWLLGASAAPGSRPAPAGEGHAVGAAPGGPIGIAPPSPEPMDDYLL
jgi:DNA-binding transcriptional ArsR family regulator